MKKTMLIFSLMLISASLTFGWSAPTFTTFNATPHDCNALQFKSGSRIYVPENAFVYSNGKLCTEPVQIKYREIHTTLDMVMHNTSMKFKDASGKIVNLESGGMFEIYAFSNGEELKLAKDKTIQVRFASQNEIEGLEGYFFNTSTNLWEKLSDPVINIGIQTNNGNTDDLWGSGPPVSFEQDEFSEWDVDDWCDDCDSEWDEWGGWGDFVESQPEIFKAMNIEEMGLYNYDRILEEEDRIPIMANFKIKGMPSDLNKIYVAYEGINSVLYFYKEEWKDKFALLPRSDYKIFAVDKEGRVAVFSEEDKAKLNIALLNGKSHTFELELDPTIPTSKQEMASITGLK